MLDREPVAMVTEPRHMCDRDIFPLLGRWQPYIYTERISRIPRPSQNRMGHRNLLVRVCVRNWIWR